MSLARVCQNDATMMIDAPVWLAGKINVRIETDICCTKGHTTKSNHVCIETVIEWYMQSWQECQKKAKKYTGAYSKHWLNSLTELVKMLCCNTRLIYLNELPPSL